MVFARRLLLLAVLLCSSVPCFSDDVSDQQIVDALTLIFEGLETGSIAQEEISQTLEIVQAKQSEISDGLERSRKAQSEISATLEKVVNEQLPDIDRRVRSQQSSFDAWERERVMLWTATAIAIVLGVAGIIF